MAFQKSVTSQIQALGNAGQIAKSSHDFLNIESYIAGDNISVGEFAQSSTNENEALSTKGKEITGAILGVIVRDSLKNANSANASLSVGAGSTIQIANAGNIFIETDKIANVGDYVFLDETDGSLYFSSELESGYIFTGWKVFIGNNSANRGVVGITTAKVAEPSAFTPLIDNSDPQIYNNSDENMVLQSRANNIQLINNKEEAIWQMN